MNKDSGKAYSYFHCDIVHLNCKNKKPNSLTRAYCDQCIGQPHIIAQINNWWHDDKRKQKQFSRMMWPYCHCACSPPAAEEIKNSLFGKYARWLSGLQHRKDAPDWGDQSVCFTHHMHQAVLFSAILHTQDGATLNSLQTGRVQSQDVVGGHMQCFIM